MIGMISCKEATYLTAKKEEGKLTLMEKIKLKLHFRICAICTLFEKQSRFISKQAAHLNDHVHATAHLSDTAKERINKSLQD